MTTHTELFDHMVRFLDADGWTVRVAQGEPLLRVDFGGHHGEWSCYGQVLQPRALCVFYSACPVKVPADRLPAAAELLMRANTNILLGAFEIDFDSGEIHFRTGLDFEDADVQPMLLKHMIYANVVAMDRYLPAIAAVIQGEAATAALAHVSASLG